MKDVLKEFKEFAIKGSVVDLAVGVIVGGAFGKIITSLVNDIVMPVVGLLVSGINFSSKVFVLRAATTDAPAITMNYGLFITNILDFIIVSFCIFIAVRYINKLRRTEKKNPTLLPEPLTPSEKLLTEIRDMLKEEKKQQ